MNMLKKIKSTVAVLIILCSGQVFADQKLSPGEIGGKAFILLEASTNSILAQYNADEKIAPASITKLMTAYVIYQSIKRGIISLDDKTVISSKAREMGGSRMFVELGSHVSIDDLLSGLVIQSGNDAAVALAEAVAGDEARFVQIMNKQAQALGMKNSQFKNVSGMPAEGHYMSARDIATLSMAIIKDFPEHYKRYSVNGFTWNGIEQENRNALLRTNPNVDGLKTGHTEAAGYCLASSAKRGQMRLVSVVMGTESVGARARASKKLLAYGFDNFLNQKLYSANQQIGETAINDGKQDSVLIGIKNTVMLPLEKTNPTNGISAKLIINQIPSAPVQKGAIVGSVQISRNGTVIQNVPAITLEAVEEIGFFARLWRWIVNTVSGWFE